MPETFDAYHKWLGIPPHERPPHHYRLLAIDPFESDPDVISSAADQRMAHVRTFQAGRHAALSQTILNEIAAARVCLLNPEKKEEYDRQLRLRLTAAPPPISSDTVRAAPPLPSSLPLPQPTFDDTIAGQLLRRRRPLWQKLAVFAFLAALFGGAVALALRQGTIPDIAQISPVSPSVPTSDSGDQPPPPEEPPPRSEPDQQPEPEPVPDQQPAEPEPVEPTPPQTAEMPEQPATTDPAAPTNPAAEPATTPETAPSTPPGPAPVPDATALAAAEATLGPSTATSTPQQLLDQATTGQRQPAERFYLLKQATQRAADAGDAATALIASEQLVEAFEVDRLAIKTETLTTLTNSPNAADSAQLIAEGCLQGADLATEAGNHELAMTLVVAALKLARDANDSELERQVTRKILNLEQAKPGAN